jgi:hypothetical protein
MAPFVVGTKDAQGASIWTYNPWRMMWLHLFPEPMAYYVYTIVPVKHCE